MSSDVSPASLDDGPESDQLEPLQQPVGAAEVDADDTAQPFRLHTK